MTVERFRAPIATGIVAAADTPAVDVDAGIIRGASAMQSVEALGHDVIADDASLARIAELGNAQTDGVKVRFTHPGLCGDGLGTYLGRMRDFRVSGDRVIGDIHLGNAAAKSPDGDLRAYVLQLAQEDPAAFGMSVVVEADRAWAMADGSEIVGDKPEHCPDDLPRLRPTALHAVDVVDEPAANRDGLFGRGAALLAMSRATNLDASEAFAALDKLRDALGYSNEKSIELLARYIDARIKKPEPISFARARALIAAHPDRSDTILAAAEHGKSERDIIAAIESDQRAELTQKTAALLTKHAGTVAAKDKEIAELRADLKRAQELAAIAKGAVSDPGTGTGTADLPSFSRDDLSAGKIPTDILESGQYTLSN